MRVLTSLIADVESPVDGRSLSCSSGIYVERGNPVCLLCLFEQESELQGELTGMRVWEDGTSKCRFVVKRIRIDLSAHENAQARTSSGAKARPRPSGASLRESLENRY